MCSKPPITQLEVPIDEFLGWKSPPQSKVSFTWELSPQARADIEVIERNARTALYRLRGFIVG